MASLSAHLRQAGDHGRLGFHADCPVCREERLFGPLSSEAVVTRRARTALVTGFVAASFTTPPAVWGQELDTRQEGTAAPHEPGDGRGTGGPSGGPESPDFDPGGDTELPLEAEGPPSAPTDGAYDDEAEGGPLELEPEVDHDVPPIEPEETPPPEGDEGAAPTAPGAPAPPPPVAEPSVPPTEEPERPDRRRAASDREPAAKRQPSRTQGDGKSDVTPPAPRATPPAPQAAPPVPQPAPPVASDASNPTPHIAQAGDQTHAGARQTGSAADSDTNRRAGARFHVVQPGESLWLIAKRTLPPDASMARIAREVNRLWELNEDRIATGDPDLLRIGTKLMLR